MTTLEGAFAGKVAVVTGATRGVGLAVARTLCAAGARVIVNWAHSEADAERALRELSGLEGEAVAVRADVTRAQELTGLLDRVRAEHGGIDLFVHNAASWHPSPAVGADPALVRADIAAGIDPLLVAAPVLAEAMEARGGRIVAVSSSGARAVVPRYVGQGLAKAALENLVRYLAVELAGRGITVNAVATAKIDKGAATPDPRAAAALAARTPAGRLTTPQDIADVVALLCTDEARWIHGQVITADGGLGLL
ncbi:MULTISPECIES: SDR family NAD(P)-dependent oxidoreductase [unclassified Streptomyces]|uniref:SDR family NAD(P)-dependent oxidoreductase n=1 Tax=unclassified Streptomyces TaxID=2593676 RepID=UPI0004BD3D29|nr:MULTISPECIES: SDR family oxidoreductase [unclassified Streptomyces]